jgi:FSR family fosmidomycin resistance protein-like MFS transporter
VSAVAARSASRPTLLALAFGHGCVDLCSGGLFALLPFLAHARHYSLSQAGVFALVGSIATAVVQPSVGAHGDSRSGRARWLLPAGLALAAVGVGAVGLTPSYPLTLAAVVVCSVGVAAYHPEGARWARFASGERVTADMSVFSVGGTLGYALSTPLVLAVVIPLGLRGTPVMMVVPAAGAVAVTLALARFRARAGGDGRFRPVGALDSEWRPFGLLLVQYCVAGGVSTGLLTYVPLFLERVRGASPTASAAVAGVLLGAEALGTLTGGVAAQRFGRRAVLVAPQLALVPLLALLPSLGYVGVVALAVPVGICLNTNVGIALVLAQEYLPAHMGLASGLTIGFTSGVGGLIVALLGVLGDAAGPAAVVYVIAALPLAVAALAALLPCPAAAPPGTVWKLPARA